MHPLESTYHGDSSFVLRGERTVAINPDGRAGADITLHTEVRSGGVPLVNGPGEYEIGGVLIVAVRPVARDARLIHAVNVDGVNVLHVENPAASLGEDDLSAIGRVDVLIVNAADAKAAEELVLDLTPRIVIP